MQATYNDTAGRIVLRARYQDRLVLKALPGSRWHPKQKVWSIPGTPHAAATLLAAASRAKLSFTGLDPQVTALADLAVAGGTVTGTTADELPNIPSTAMTPRAHQKVGYHLLNAQPATYLAWDMGTGKTKTVIDFIANRDDIEIALVVCPASVVPVWEEQVPAHARKRFDVVRLYGSPKRPMPIKKRLQLIKLGLARKLPGVPLVFVTNYEAVWREDISKAFQEMDLDLLVADEAHRIKSPSGRTSRWFAKMTRHARLRVCLSGTPMPHSPLDVFAQFRFLDPGIFGTSFTAFRARYAVMGGFGGHQVIGWQHQEELHELFYRIAHRVRSEEVLDLPPVQHIPLRVDLSPAGQKVYGQMRDTLVAELQGGVVSAAGALPQLIRLQQITSGHLPDPEGDGTTEVCTAKRDALRDILEDLPPGEAVAVFCLFRADLDAVHAAAKATGRQSVELSGRAKDIQGTWKADQGTVAAAQINAGGLGIDLTRAAYQVFYSLGFSLGDYQQAIKRTHRQGQTRPVTYYHLIARNTVNEHVYKALRSRRDLVEHVVDVLRGILPENAA